MNFRILALLLLGPLLSSWQLVAQQNTQAEGAPGSIDGRVTNSVTGDAISGASVHLYPQYVRGSANNPLTATTQGDGSFRIESVPPGSYFIVAEQSSFTNVSSGIPVRVDDGQQVSNIALQLKPFATMAGKVVDENGNPVPDVQVTAYMVYDWRGHTQLRAGSTATTGKDGTYQLKKIAPGRYFLAADPSPENPPKQNSPKRNETAEEANIGYELVRTFYPNSLTLEGAAELDITASQNASDTNIHIQRAATHRVQGNVEELESNTTALNATLSLAPQGALPWAGLSRTVKAAKNGTFILEHVVSGNYTLWLTSIQRSANGRGGSAQKLLARQNIDVSAEDVTGIVLTVLPPVSLTGKVVFDNATSQNLAQLHIALIPGGEMMFGSYAMANVNPDGSFSVPHVDPGEYRVVVQGAPAASYVQSIEYNRQDVTKTGIDLSQGGGGEVDIVLRMGAAEVDGTVETSNGNSDPVHGIAVLVPEQVASDGSGTLVGQVAANDSFVVKNVPPGRYFAVVIQRLTGVWQNVSFLREIEREGASVDVEENRRAQVQAPLISDQDIQQIAGRLGLSTD